MTQTTNDRQETLAVPSGSVSIVGIGGIGSWAALMASKAGFEVHVYDGDTVSETDLHRTPYQVSHIGQLKTDALAGLLGYPMHSAAHIGHLGTHAQWNKSIAAHYFLTDWVIAAVDSYKVRLDLYRWAKKISAVYIDAGCEGHGAQVSDSPALVGDDEPGYRITPQWAGPNIFAAVMAVSRMVYRTRGTILLDKGEVNVLCHTK